mgnify:CR=1 FL=1
MGQDGSKPEEATPEQAEAVTKVQALVRGNSVRNVKKGVGFAKEPAKPTLAEKVKTEPPRQPWQANPNLWMRREEALDAHYQAKAARKSVVGGAQPEPEAESPEPRSPSLPAGKTKRRGARGFMFTRRRKEPPEPATPESTAPPPTQLEPMKGGPPAPGLETAVAKTILADGRRYEEGEAVMTFGELTSLWQDKLPEGKDAEEWHDDLIEVRFSSHPVPSAPRPVPPISIQ